MIFWRFVFFCTVPGSGWIC